MKERNLYGPVTLILFGVQAATPPTDHFEVQFTVILIDEGVQIKRLRFYNNFFFFRFTITLQRILKYKNTQTYNTQSVQIFQTSQLGQFKIIKI